MTGTLTPVGDAIPANCHVLELHVGDLNQLFNAMDPAPFRERDLDPKAEEFIVGWARELHTPGPLALVVHLDRQKGTVEEATMLKDAVRQFFAHRAMATRQRLRQMLRVGRTSLIIGLVFLTASIIGGDLFASMTGNSHFGGIVRESLLIGGWVAMWRPLEIFLYDWWPILREARLLEQLSRMAVQIVAAAPTVST